MFHLDNQGDASPREQRPRDDGSRVSP